MRRFRGFGVLLVAAIVVGGCGGPSQTVKDAEGQVANPNRPVQLLLRGRTAKLNAGDVEGFLAPLSPAARAFEEPLARRAMTMPVQRFDMTLGTATISDDGGHFRNAAVTLRYTFKALPPDNPFRVHLLYDLDRTPQGWVVTSSQLDRRPSSPPPPLWASGPVAFSETPHILVMARPGVARVGDLASMAEKAYADVRPRLSLVPDPKLLLVLAQSTREFLDNGGDKSLLALASVQYVAAGAPLHPEERFVFADLQAITEDRRVQVDSTGEPVDPGAVFQHELSHLALSRFTRPCTTLWVEEGAAMMLAGERRSGQWKAMVSSGSLDRQGLDAVPLNYPLANAAVLYLVEKYGTAKFFDFYQNFKSLPAQGCAGRVADVRSSADERLLRRYYRVGVTDLEGYARDYIRKAVAAP